MKLKASPIPLFIVFIASMLILPVYAPEGVDLSEFPQQLADAMNLPLIAGQMLASTLILFLFLAPTLLLLNKHASQSTAVLVVGISVMGFLIGAGWLPYWFLLVLCLLVAVMYAGKFRDFLSGG